MRNSGGKLRLRLTGPLWELPASRISPDRFLAHFRYFLHAASQFLQKLSMLESSLAGGFVATEETPESELVAKLPKSHGCSARLLPKGNAT
jgi:hypothetical protein